MTLLQWIQRNIGANYEVYCYDERSKQYIPNQTDIRKLYDKTIDRIQEIPSHKFVFNKKNLQMELDKPLKRIFVR